MVEGVQKLLGAEPAGEPVEEKEPEAMETEKEPEAMETENE